MTQSLANALIAAAGYLLVGLGFSLIYTTARVFHFAHGMVLTVGAYVTFALNIQGDLPLSVSIIGGIATSTLLGGGIECVVYRPLRERRASDAVLLLASIGIYVALQAVVALWFGAGTQTFRSGNVPEGHQLLGIWITAPQFAMIGVGLASWVLIALLLQETRLGKTLRAVACDPDLAVTRGLESNRIIFTAFLIGSALAGTSAVLLAWDTDISPTMGLKPLLMSLIAVIIGGVGNYWGIGVGAILLGLTQHLSAWWLSSKWQDAIAFAILVAFLALRPQGFFGKALRKGVV